MSDVERTYRERMEERVLAIENVEQAFAKLNEARVTYNEALMSASALGVTNVKLAEIIGQSETAVRTYLRRRRLGVPQRGL